MSTSKKSQRRSRMYETLETKSKNENSQIEKKENIVANNTSISA